jgi:hypothetical protein
MCISKMVLSKTVPMESTPQDLYQTSHGTFAVPTLLPYRTFPSTYPHTFWPSVRNTVFNLIRPSHGTIPYRTVRHRNRTVIYCTVRYGTVPYRIVLAYRTVRYRSNAYGQRKYMSPARIDLASQPLNTADSQKFPYRKSVGQKCWTSHPNTFFPTLFGNLLSESTVRYHVKDELDVFPYDLHKSVYISKCQM